MSTKSGGIEGGGGDIHPPLANPTEMTLQPGMTSMTPAVARDGNNASSAFKSTTPAWAGGGPTDRPPRMRSFAEIMSEQKMNRNILELIMKKKPTADSAGNVTVPKNLNYDDLETFFLIP